MALDIQGERWLVMGKPKAGKSTFAASFPDWLVINLDGARNKYAYPDRERRIDAYDLVQLKEAFKEVGKRKGWRTLVLDPLDNIVTWIDADICKRMQYSSIGDIPHGAGWTRQTSMYVGIVDEFWKAAETNEKLMASIVVAHSKSGDDGQSMCIRKALLVHVQGGVNNIVYIGKKKRENRLVYEADLSGSEKVEAGCRNPTLQEAGVVPASFSEIMGLFDPGADEMEKAYGWLETKGGIDRGTFDQLLEQRGIMSNVEKYEKIREARKEASVLKALQKAAAAERSNS